MDDYKSLEAKIGYQFKNHELLLTALSHRSLGPNSNERLEFLGDSILSLIISSELYQRYPELQEGGLSRIRASLVNRDMLARLARELGINQSIRLGMAELKSGGKERQSILADALEAIIGAIYLDAGLEVCNQCVLAWFTSVFNETPQLSMVKDAKSALQEWAQANKYSLPQYQVSAILGAAHNQTFQITCRIQGLDYLTSGEAGNRRSAEQQAAEHYLRLILGSKEL